MIVLSCNHRHVYCFLGILISLQHPSLLKDTLQFYLSKRKILFSSVTNFYTIKCGLDLDISYIVGAALMKNRD